MRVHAVPATITVAPDTQLADAVFAADRANGELVLFQQRSAGGWRPVTSRQFAADVRGLAAGFLAAGIQPGGRVALLAATSYEWTLVDYALWTVAAVPVPIYETSSAEQVRWVLFQRDFAAEIEELYRCAPGATVRPAAPRARDRRWTGW